MSLDNNVVLHPELPKSKHCKAVTSLNNMTEVTKKRLFCIIIENYHYG